MKNVYILDTLVGYIEYISEEDKVRFNEVIMRPTDRILFTQKAKYVKGIEMNFKGRYVQLG